MRTGYAHNYLVAKYQAGCFEAVCGRLSATRRPNPAPAELRGRHAGSRGAADGCSLYPCRAPGQPGRAPTRSFGCSTGVRAAPGPPCSGWVWGGEAVVTPQGIVAPKFDAYVPAGQAAAAPSRPPLAAVDSLGFRSPRRFRRRALLRPADLARAPGWRPWVVGCFRPYRRTRSGAGRPGSAPDNRTGRGSTHTAPALSAPGGASCQASTPANGRQGRRTIEGRSILPSCPARAGRQCYRIPPAHRVVLARVPLHLRPPIPLFRYRRRRGMLFRHHGTHLHRFARPRLAAACQMPPTSDGRSDKSRHGQRRMPAEFRGDGVFGDSGRYTKEARSSRLNSR